MGLFDELEDMLTPKQEPKKEELSPADLLLARKREELALKKETPRPVSNFVDLHQEIYGPYSDKPSPTHREMLDGWEAYLKTNPEPRMTVPEFKASIGYIDDYRASMPAGLKELQDRVFAQSSLTGDEPTTKQGEFRYEGDKIVFDENTEGRFTIISVSPVVLKNNESELYSMGHDPIQPKFKYQPVEDWKLKGIDRSLPIYGYSGEPLDFGQTPTPEGFNSPVDDGQAGLFDSFLDNIIPSIDKETSDKIYDDLVTVGQAMYETAFDKEEGLQMKYIDPTEKTLSQLEEEAKPIQERDSISVPVSPADYESLGVFMPVGTPMLDQARKFGFYNPADQKPYVHYEEPKKEQIKLIVKGDPTAQKRHRSVRMGGFTRQYDPSASDKADFLSIVQANAPEVPISSPIRLEMRFYFARPKSHFGIGKKEGKLKDTAPNYHTARPDVDNCIKFCCDSLNKIYWKDDSYIVECLASKLYSENPRTEITIIKL